MMTMCKPSTRCAISKRPDSAAGDVSIVSRYRDNGELDDEASGAATGASVGALAGAGTGLLTALGVIAIPG